MIQADVLAPPFPASSKATRIHWGNLTDNEAVLAVSNLLEQTSKPFLILTPDVHSANQWIQTLKFFTQGQDLPILSFPAWETLPYDHFSPHPDIISERLQTLFKLPSLQKGAVVCAIYTAMHRLCPVNYLNANVFLLSCKDSFSLETQRHRLIQGGYQLVPEVRHHGEFAIRGSIVDIFPMGSRFPYRIELEDNIIITLRRFDLDTQRSIEKLEHIRILPVREYELSDTAIARFRQAWRANSPESTENLLYRTISQHHPAPGAEYYLPLFFSNTDTLFDYLTPDTGIILLQGAQNEANRFWKTVQERYEQLRYDRLQPLCSYQELFLSPEETYKRIKNFSVLSLNENAVLEKAGRFNFTKTTFPNLLIQPKSKTPYFPLTDFISKKVYDFFLFCAETRGREDFFIKILNEQTIYPTHVNTWQEFIKNKPALALTTAPFDKGFLLPEAKIAVIPESELFGKKLQQQSHEKNGFAQSNIRNLVELKIGDPIVHLDHGVGKYLGLQTLKTGGIEADYLTLEYAQGDKIYVPINALYLINRYIGIDSDHPPLQKLGSKQWNKVKEQAMKRVWDVAAELLAAEGERAKVPGFVYQLPKEYNDFAQAFPFEETEDQKKAITEIIRDMTSAKPMDRLICGDVGFGKTEIAMRATFIAVQNHRQVVLLAPTTLLTAQHLRNFQDRFAGWPIEIAGISRLHSATEIKRILNEVASGKIDILIGTHKLFDPKLKFKNLGLLVIDEEHRFGVRQKERLKALRFSVDILTLTATPIPRTLNMALSGARDLSIIATPPAKRLSIKTFVHEYDAALIREAILRETMRGGQIYYLHNTISSMESTREKLKRLIPDVRVEIAHGQLPERQLETIMSDFYHQKFQVLLCSTIIESGIDIPTANTIMVENADRFGLAQLHQLRGRVGRSHHQAYAYLFINSFKALKEDAKKRLDAITQFDQLGIGFNLATLDLEIRGAGELLGAKQSGHIQAIGFTLYSKLLTEAVDALKQGKEPSLESIFQQEFEIDLGVSTIFPENYIPPVELRLTLYKRLANLTTLTEIEQFEAELIDRFGPLPEKAKFLIEATKFKCAAKPLGIVKITLTPSYGHFYFIHQPNINMEKLMSLVIRTPKQYRLEPEHFKFQIQQEDIHLRLKAVWEMLNQLI